MTHYQQLNLDLKNRSFSRTTVEATIRLIHRSKEYLPYLRDALDQYLVALSRSPNILLQLDVGLLESYIALSRQSFSSDQIADNLSIIAAELCSADLSLIAPLFELLASGLSPEKLNATFCFAARSFDDDLERCIRLAESMRKFAHETSLALLLIKLHRTKPSWLHKPKLLRSFQPLLSSPFLHALASLVGEETISRIRSLLKVTDRFRDAVTADDRVTAIRILRSEDELVNVDFLRWMNSLRGVSFELKKMALSVSDIKISGIHDPLWQKLAAVRFFDANAIKTMRDSGTINSRSDLNAAALSVIGDNSMLNEIIADKYRLAHLSPMTVEGGTASEVFVNAAESTRNLPKVEGPLISVIMSAYNPDLDLMKISLDSIKHQTWNNIEVIIVDDASDGPAQTALGKLAASYDSVALIRVPVNSGPYVGRNLAIHEARGKFIAIQDADDWSHPQRLAAQVSFLLNTPEARAVTTEHIRINRAGNVALESGFRVFGDGPMTSLFRAEVFQQIGRFAATRSRGDLEMRERIAAYYGDQGNAALLLPMMLCYADSTTLSNITRTQKLHHIKLFHNNVAQMQDLNSLFRDGLVLSDKHQVPVPIMLRAPQ